MNWQIGFQYEIQDSSSPATDTEVGRIRSLRLSDHDDELIIAIVQGNLEDHEFKGATEAARRGQQLRDSLSESSLEPSLWEGERLRYDCQGHPIGYFSLPRNASLRLSRKSEPENSGAAASGLVTENSRHRTH